jgi:hypothetical protein
MLDSTDRDDTSQLESDVKEDKVGVGLTIDVDEEHDRSNVTFDRAADKECQERAQELRERIADSDLLNQWDLFSFSKLKAVLDHQMLGSYEVPAPEISIMQVCDSELHLLCSGDRVVDAYSIVSSKKRILELP